MAARGKTRSQQAENKFDPQTYPYLQCREQHDWKFYDGTILEAAREIHIVKKCANCGTKRPRVLSMRGGSRGAVESTNYKHPKDYQIRGGLSADERGEIRLRNALALLAEHGIKPKKKG
jgi:hypothetical protein